MSLKLSKSSNFLTTFDRSHTILTSYIEQDNAVTMTESRPKMTEDHMVIAAHVQRSQSCYVQKCQSCFVQEFHSCQGKTSSCMDLKNTTISNATKSNLTFSSSDVNEMDDKPNNRILLSTARSYRSTPNLCDPTASNKNSSQCTVHKSDHCDVIAKSLTVKTNEYKVSTWRPVTSSMSEELKHDVQNSNSRTGLYSTYSISDLLPQQCAVTQQQYSACEVKRDVIDTQLVESTCRTVMTRHLNGVIYNRSKPARYQLISREISADILRPLQVTLDVTIFNVD